MHEIRLYTQDLKPNRILMEGTYEEVKSQIEMLKHKYGANTPISAFISDPFIWVEP